MGIFGGIGGVKATKNGNWIMPGSYVCRIDAVRLDKRRAGDEFVIFEMEVLLVQKIAMNDDGEPVSHHAGEQIGHMILNGGTPKQRDMFLPNLKAAVMGIMGIPEADVTEEVCAELVSDAQPLAGLVVRVEANQILTQGKQTPFTKVVYHGAESRAAFEKKGGVPQEGWAFFEDMQGE